jgi:hypothetical protein
MDSLPEDQNRDNVVRITTGQTQQKTQSPNNLFIVSCVFVAVGMCLPSRCIAMDVY